MQLESSKPEPNATQVPERDRGHGAVSNDAAPSERTVHEAPEPNAPSAELKQVKETFEDRLLESEKMAAVGRLAASIAHEINNPLEAVTNLLYLARQDACLSDDCRQYLDQAEQELSRVTEIVSQTLRFQRSRAQPTECVPEALVYSVVALHQGKLRNSNIQIHRQHRRSRAFLCAESDLRQILNNLLSNAIDATRNGGGRITIRTAPARDARSGQEGVRISVADTGHGMNRETAEQIFEPLYTTKGSGGSGLGLWISNAIAKRHSGHLTVRSSTNRRKRGTTFSLFLPHAESHAAA